MSRAGSAPFESPLLRAVSGPTLRPGGLELTKRAMELSAWGPGQRVLDLGCGLGASAEYLVSRGIRALGLDLSPALLGEARGAHPNLPLLRGEAMALPLAPASLDGVLCECVLSLCPDPGAVLAECRRVLKPNGRLALSDLYLRQPSAPGTASPAPGCLGGARPREFIERLLVETGLELLVWEDHSDLLRRLAAQLVWAHGSLEALWGGAGDSCSGAGQPGYSLLKARRKD